MTGRLLDTAADLDTVTPVTALLSGAADDVVRSTFERTGICAAWADPASDDNADTGCRDATAHGAAAHGSTTTINELVHELRTPLAALVALTSELPDDQQARIERLTRHIGRILDRAEQHLHPACVSQAEPAATLHVLDVVRHAACLFSTAHPNRTVDLIGVADRAIGDPTAIIQILVNLLNNADRHGPADTPITVTVGQDEDTTRVVVSDHGPGIPGPIADLVFQTGVSVSDDPVNRGLGLALSRRLAEQMGGTLTVTPDTSNVTLTLPRPT